MPDRFGLTLRKALLRDWRGEKFIVIIPDEDKN